MMSQASQRHVLIIDRWENMNGEVVALVLQRQRGDRTHYLYQPCTPDEILAARDVALEGGTYFTN